MINNNNNVFYILILAFVLIVISVWALKQNIYPRMLKEAFTSASLNDSCFLSVQEFNRVVELADYIKTSLESLEDYPWEDHNKFRLIRTVMVTRVEYLLHTYGDRLSVSDFVSIKTETYVENVMKEMEDTYSGLLQNVFDAYNEIWTILYNKRSNLGCSSCDPVSIKHSLERMDNEFSMYFANMFRRDDLLIKEDTKKTLAKLEISMVNVTKMIDDALWNQRLDMQGKLELRDVENTLGQIHSLYLALVADLDLYKALGRSLDDIMTFIEVKKIIVNDIKKCIVAPVFYPSCYYKGTGVVVSEGEYLFDRLKQELRLETIGSIQVPSTYTVFFEFTNGDVRMFEEDQPCLTDWMRGSIKKLTISYRRAAHLRAL